MKEIADGEECVIKKPKVATAMKTILVTHVNSMGESLDVAYFVVCDMMSYRLTLFFNHYY